MSDAKHMVVGDFAFLTLELPVVDLTLGLREDLVSDNEMVKSVQSIEKEDLYVGWDGVFVKLGPAWSQENMRMQPEDRE